MKSLISTVMLVLTIVIPALTSSGAENGQDIEGVVLDRTRTRGGGKFFQEFIARWEPPPGAPSYMIIIQETPNPQWGSIITVQLNDGVIFKGVLPGRVADIPAAAARTVDVAERALFAPEEDGLTAGDLKGSGLR